MVGSTKHTAKAYRNDINLLLKLNQLLCLNISLISHPLKTIFQHKVCTDKLYADSFYKIQKNSHSSFEVICCRR